MVQKTHALTVITTDLCVICLVLKITHLAYTLMDGYIEELKGEPNGI